MRTNLRYLTIALAALALAACVPNKAYRKGPQSLLTEEVKGQASRPNVI